MQRNVETKNFVVVAMILLLIHVGVRYFQQKSCLINSYRTKHCFILKHIRCLKAHWQYAEVK